jgi:hypothetical protein
MDKSVHCTPEEWEVLLDDNGYHLISLRDKRYDCVFHMVNFI